MIRIENMLIDVIKHGIITLNFIERMKEMRYASLGGCQIETRTDGAK